MPLTPERAENLEGSLRELMDNGVACLPLGELVDMIDRDELYREYVKAFTKASQKGENIRPPTSQEQADYLNQWCVENIGPGVVTVKIPAKPAKPAEALVNIGALHSMATARTLR